MESLSQNPDIRINPENFHPCTHTANWKSNLVYFLSEDSKTGCPIFKNKLLHDWTKFITFQTITNEF